MSKAVPFKLDIGLTQRLAAKFENPFGGDASSWEVMNMAGTVAYAQTYATQFLDRFAAEWDEHVSSEGRLEALWERLDDDRRHALLVLAASRHFNADLRLAAYEFQDRMLGDDIGMIMWELDHLELLSSSHLGEVAVKHDDFGNTATVRRRMGYPYKGAPCRKESFVLTLTADYDAAFVYHVSVYESMEEVDAALAKLSCGTWH